jgi:hypothetical protein
LEFPKAAGIAIFDYLGETLLVAFLAPKTAGISSFVLSEDCFLFNYNPLTLSASEETDLRSNMALRFLTFA